MARPSPEVAQWLGGSRALYLVTTHVHPEHDLGAQAFPAATRMLRARAQVQDIEEFGLQTAELFRSRSAINAELLKDASFRKADVNHDGVVSENELTAAAIHSRRMDQFIQGADSNRDGSVSKPEALVYYARREGPVN